MKKKLCIAAMSLGVAAVLALQTGAAYADDDESPVAAIATAEPTAAAEGKCAQINVPYGSGPALWNVTKERC